MNSELKSKWLAALRSGDYKQGRKLLRDKDNKYCCMGVLCEIMGIEGVLDEPSRSYKYLDHAGMPPPRVDEEIGGHYITNALADMNDSDKKSFSEIADWIEETL